MKLVLAAILVVVGATTALLSNRQLALTQEDSGPTYVMRSAGAVAAIIGTLAALNFLYALVLVKRMKRGDDVIGRWTVTPDEFERFQQIEGKRKKRKNNWRAPRRAPKAGLQVIFSRDAVLIGKSYFQLRTQGMSRFTNARIDAESAVSIEFAMTLTVVGAGSQGRTARYRGHLRVPVADAAHGEAARIVGYFQNSVSL